MTNISDILPDDESLEKESPILHSISKENPFSVPENYFDSLPSEIIKKCQEQVVSRTSSTANGNLPSYILNLKSFVLGYKWRVLAATACVAIMCFIAVTVNKRPVSYEAMAQNIPDSLIVEHFNNNITDINVSTLEDIEGTESTSAKIKSVSDSANTDQDIIAYLMNNNISVSDIENE